MKNCTKLNAVLVSLVILSMGCVRMRDVSSRDLDLSIHQVPGAIWYYMGTTNGYHYLYQRLPVVSLVPLPECKYARRYRIADEELPLLITFPYTTVETNWLRTFRKPAPLTPEHHVPYDVSIEYIPGSEDVPPRHPGEW